MIPATGDIVRIRSRQYFTEGGDLPPQPDDSPLIRMSCTDDDAQGEPLEGLWEREIDAQLLRETDCDRIDSCGFDEPRLFLAYLHALRWSCVTATDAKLLQAPYRAGSEVETCQLQPLRMALGRLRVNLFIVDYMGRGKTIAAGLIVRELVMRQKVQRVVSYVLLSVVRQWRDEMEERFGLTFVIYSNVGRIEIDRLPEVRPCGPPSIVHPDAPEGGFPPVRWAETALAGERHRPTTALSPQAGTEAILVMTQIATRREHCGLLGIIVTLCSVIC